MTDMFGRNWRHVFKLDPAKFISDEHLQRLYESGTHALFIGGSSGVDSDNTKRLLDRIFTLRSEYEGTSAPQLVCEMTSSDLAIPGFDYYLIPTVINTADYRWIHGHHRQAFTHFGDLVPWQQTAAEGYIILNPTCTAAILTQAEAELDDEQVLACVTVADRLFRLPFIYIEYSGVFGDMKLLQKIASKNTAAQLIYGGGIRTAEQAAEVARWAHTVVVGNLIYEHVSDAITTVAAVCQTNCEW
jgi:putative glycerol-1-phosphate prenyltransferase